MTDNCNYYLLEDFKRYHVPGIKKRIEQILKVTEPSSLKRVLQYTFESQGKMLRSILVLISTKAVGGALKDVYDIAVSMELFHNFTLAHDDIMDNAKKRRGRVTLHKKYGLNKAILSGDLLLVLAYDNLFNDCNPDNVKKIASLFASTVIKVCEGQGQDIEFETRKNISIIEYKKMIYNKTASFTEMCCEIAGIINNSPEEYIKSLKKYGKYLGMAFQIQDDILDIFGNEKELGKKLGGDLIEGKKTYLLVKALSKSRGKDREYLYRIIKGGVLIDEITKYRDLCIRLDVLKDAEMEVSRYLKLAKNSLNCLPENDGKHLMKELLNKINNRKK